jgi:hypothetical protein
MIKKLFLLLFLLQSCAFISYNQIIPLIKSATVGEEDIELSAEFISQQPYSFIRVDLGKGANIIMVLQKIRDGVYTWVSSEGEKIETFNGKVIRTSGLIHNIDIINFKDFKYFSPSNSYSGTFNIMLKDPSAFVEQEFIISLIEGDDNLLFEERIKLKILNASYSNFYTLDIRSGMPISSKQKIHPMLPEFKIDFIYKY